MTTVDMFDDDDKKNQGDDQIGSPAISTEPPTEEFPPDDPGPLPDFLDRKKTMSPEEYDAAIERARNPKPPREPRIAAPEPKAIDSGTTALVAEIDKKLARKRRAKAETKKAVANGDTTKMPATGRAALAIIEADPERDTEMATTQTSGRTKAAPPPKSRKAKAAKAKAVKPGKAKKTVKPAKARAVNGLDKMGIIKRMLTRTTGCTAKELMTACGWVAIGIPEKARALGLKLRKEKVQGKPTRYFGS